MSICGRVIHYTVLTLDQELNACQGSDVELRSYIVEKHKLAEDYGRYVVRFTIRDERLPMTQFANVFIPKGVVDNDLIEPDNYIECNGNWCCLSVIGVTDYFDRAFNGATYIHDLVEK